jgi:hypothetical protein
LFCCAHSCQSFVCSSWKEGQRRGGLHGCEFVKSGRMEIENMDAFSEQNKCFQEAAEGSKDSDASWNQGVPEITETPLVSESEQMGHPSTPAGCWRVAQVQHRPLFSLFSPLPFSFPLPPCSQRIQAWVRHAKNYLPKRVNRLLLLRSMSICDVIHLPAVRALAKALKGHNSLSATDSLVILINLLSCSY